MFAELWQDSDKLLLRLDLPPGANPGVILHDGNAYVRKAADSCEYRKAEVYAHVTMPVLPEREEK